MQLILCKYEESVARLTNDIITNAIINHKCRQRKKYTYKFTFAKQSMDLTLHLDQLNIFPLDITKLINEYTINGTISVNLIKRHNYHRYGLYFVIKIYIIDTSYNFELNITQNDIRIYARDNTLNIIPDTICIGTYEQQHINYWLLLNQYEKSKTTDPKTQIFEDIMNIFEIIINYVANALR